MMEGILESYTFYLTFLVCRRLYDFNLMGTREVFSFYLCLEWTFWVIFLVMYNVCLEQKYSPWHTDRHILESTSEKTWGQQPLLVMRKLLESSLPTVGHTHTGCEVPQFRLLPRPVPLLGALSQSQGGWPSDQAHSPLAVGGRCVSFSLWGAPLPTNQGVQQRSEDCRLTSASVSSIINLTKAPASQD